MALIQFKEPFIPVEEIYNKLNMIGANMRISNTYYDGAIINALDKNEEHCRALIPAFSTNGYHEKKLLEQIAKKTSLCALRVQTMYELQTHALAAYEVSIAHYLLGKKYVAGFPKNRCATSSLNVMLSLILHGYENALIVRKRSRELQHTYVALPFILNDRTGLIYVDPTAEQCWTLDPPKTSVLLRWDEHREYRLPYQRTQGPFNDFAPNRAADKNCIKTMLCIPCVNNEGKVWAMPYYDDCENGAEETFALAYKNSVRAPQIIHHDIMQYDIDDDSLHRLNSDYDILPAVDNTEPFLRTTLLREELFDGQSHFSTDELESIETIKE